MQKRGPEIVGEGPIKFRPPKLPTLAPKLYLFVAAGFVLLMLLFIPYFMFLEYVEPNEFGIKEIKVGVNRGIQSTVYGPGYVLVVPFMQMIHRLPQQVQVLELTAAGNQGETAARSESVFHVFKPAKIQTSDGFYVDVDVSILYRIVDPYKVVTTLGPGDRYLQQGILPKAEPFLKQALGQLTTEEFYNSPMRVEKSQLAQDELNKELEQWGMKADQILVRYFKYSDAIQENIEEKKLQDQLVFTNQSKGKAAAEEKNLNHVSTAGEMQVQITHQEGDAYKVRKEAERDLYVRKKRAEADLLVQLAEAERTRLRNEAMQEMGANRLVAMKMAEVLQGLEMIVVPAGGENAFNPLNLNEILDMFGGAEPSASTLAAPASKETASPAPAEITPPPPPPPDEAAPPAVEQAPPAVQPAEGQS
ncbi:MAG: SPFH domain-containing protein [Candidatus Hydrogenedentes bacterium]|nr:SPFH domain-containing protein [Candidatus Hydrogenedentota bacterium]